MRGFTLIELAIVLGLFAVIASFSLALGARSLQGDALRSQRATLAGALEHARAQAFANMGQAPHGVCYDQTAGRYVLFAGAGYEQGAPGQEYIPASAAVSVSAQPDDFSCATGAGAVFSQLAATTAPVVITLAEGARAYRISLNDEGRIEQ